MNSNIVYSFIIPHKNSPKLLLRCIDSIPVRDDVQIIIVDDNSVPDKRPIISRCGVEVYFIDDKNSKGAGHARNVGLKKAKGKWILFADADDYYENNLSYFLNKYKYSSHDVIYFNVNFIDLRNRRIRNYVNNYSQTLEKVKYDQESVDCIKYRYTAPWNKMINKEFIERKQIVFEEVLQGNDIYFSYQVGYLAKNIEYDNTIIYNYLFHDNNLTNHDWSVKKCICYIDNSYKIKNFMRFIGHKNWGENPMFIIAYLMIRNYKIIFSLGKTILIEYRNIYSKRKFYVKQLCNKK